MENLIFYCPLEYHYSQADDDALVIGLVYYEQKYGKIAFEFDKKKVQEHIYSYYPKVKFTIIETYLELIHKKIAKNPVDKYWSENNLKQYLANYVLTPDDSALQFGKITADKENELQKTIKTYFQTTSIQAEMKNKFDVLITNLFQNEQNKHFIGKNLIVSDINNSLKIDKVIGYEKRKNFVFFINYETASGLKRINEITEKQYLFNTLQINYEVDFWINTENNTNKKQEIITEIRKKFKDFVPNIYFSEQWNGYANKISKKYMEKKAKIYYFSLTDEQTKTEKLEWFKNTKLQDIDFQLVKPDKNANWINLTDNDFDTLIPLIDYEVKSGVREDTIFKLFNNGVSTNRDAWVYDINRENLKNKINHFIDRFNELQKNKDMSFPTDIKWSHFLKNKFISGEYLTFKPNMICNSIYRPYHKVFYYCDLRTSDLLTEYHFQIFGENLKETNKVIWFKCGKDWDFFALGINYVHDILPQGGSKCLPLYRYSNGERVENITDWALALFRNHYESPLTPEGGTDEITSKIGVPNHPPLGAGGLTKLDIFHYVYAVLHQPDYRTKYEQNLKREFPRIPLYDDFWKYAEAGKKLMELHLNYESPLTPEGGISFTSLLTRKDLDLEGFKAGKQGKKKKESPNIETMHVSPLTPEGGTDEITSKTPPSGAGGLVYPILKIKDGNIEIDELTTLCGVPAQALAYKLGNRSAIEWILDQYKPYKSDDKTIQEQFNNYNFADYKEQVIELLQKVCWLSVETMKIVGEL